MIFWFFFFGATSEREPMASPKLNALPGAGAHREAFRAAALLTLLTRRHLPGGAQEATSTCCSRGACSQSAESLVLRTW